MENTIDQIQMLLQKYAAAVNATEPLVRQLCENSEGGSSSEKRVRPYELGIPSIGDLYADIATLQIIAIAVSLMLFTVTMLIHVRQVKYLLKTTPREYKARTLLMNSAYPLVAGAAVISILVPRAILIGDTICHITFTMLAYQFYCLAIQYVGGESNLLKLCEGSTDAFSLRTLPLFCCCPCLKPSAITKRKLFYLRMMILQMPIVQGTLMVALNVVNAEEPNKLPIFTFYLGVFVVTSILTGVWGLNIALRLLVPFCAEYRLKGKFLAIQLVLITCKLLPYIVHQVMKSVYSQGSSNYPMTPRVNTNVSLQMVIMVLNIVLALWARFLYRNSSSSETSQAE